MSLFLPFNFRPKDVVVMTTSYTVPVNEFIFVSSATSDLSINSVTVNNSINSFIPLTEGESVNATRYTIVRYEVS